MEDLKAKKADITYGQILPSMRRQWHKLASIRKVRFKLPTAHTIHFSKSPAVLPVVASWIQGQKMDRIYLDGGTHVCVITEEAMNDLGLEMTVSLCVLDWLTMLRSSV